MDRDPTQPLESGCIRVIVELKVEPEVAMDWKDSVYSDGSPWFVTPEAPVLGSPVTIGLQMLANDEVKQVVLRLMRNGSEVQVPMVRQADRGPLAVWQAQTVMNQSQLNYHFYVVTETAVWFYNQQGLTDVPPAEDRDFRLSATDEVPRWVRGAVFYQIFPDRFCNGDPSLTVQTGEYHFDGHPTVQMPWGTPPKEYREVFCLDFYGGDLPGIQQKIGYLQDLGITALYLNPIFHSATSHRYDCLDFFHVDPHLGGDQALAQLSASLKAQGLRLMVDVSINHTGTAHRWFLEAARNPQAPERAYYFFGPGNEYHQWAGVETLPTLNYTSPALRQILYRGEDSVVQKWLRPPYSIDAWRFDVANDMAKKDEIDQSHEVWSEIHQTIRSVNPEAYVLAEHWTDASAYLQGGEWDSAMNYYGSARPIRQFVGLGDLFLSKFTGTSGHRPRLTAPQMARWITGHLSRLPWQNQVSQFNLLGSHDTDRIHNHPELTWGAYETAVMMLFTLPGAPNVYYGDEVGLEGRTDSNEGFRYPMEWDPARWKPSFVALYRSLCRLKTGERALQDGGFQILFAEGFTIAWVRFTPDAFVLLVASMEDSARTVHLPVARIGAEPRWEVETVDTGAKESPAWAWDKTEVLVTLPPGRGVLFRGRKNG
jgi:alpha-glucosidase